jgi:NADH-quinone oxidoreductase subunit G
LAKEVNLIIDGKAITVPEGTLIVDAAKKVGIDIPVFCYHPKMEPVGMCRMCLVDVGRPVIDRNTGSPILEADGSPKIQFGQKLETACTTPVGEGMVVIGMSDKVLEARKDIIEFLLTSHPLDCPICDKGGECPLQNLTMAWGPGESRFEYSQKQHLAKHVPLGELIYLDRERCIQCGRCVRFQETLAEDPVIGFYNRGRRIEIVSFSEPGFDSYWSGNTTDICPVGALTTADFRFRARPWELKAGASLCPQCPVGCNTTLNIRREAAANGEVVIKRTMPRQNEKVNEIWICDKGRFGYHYAQDPERLTQPLVRKHGKLTPVSWDEALDVVAERFKDVRNQQVGDGLLVVAGGHLSNEDLFNLRELSNGLGAQTALYSNMAGGELTLSLGLAPGSNLGDLEKGSAILVVASDLEEEAPVWWLRINQAAKRGVALVVMNPRPTKLDAHATHVVRYPYGSEPAAVLALLNLLSAKRPNLPEIIAVENNRQNLSHSPELQAAAKTLVEAENLVVFYGSEGIGLDGSQALAQACANLLLATGHVGRANNGLVGVWRRANDQGAWELGWRPHSRLYETMQQAPALYVVAADPAGDDPARFSPGGFLVLQDLFLTATARLADVVLPAQSWVEREGTFTSGERRVQRYYPAIPERQGAMADFKITGSIAERIGLKLELLVPFESRFASKVFERLCNSVPAFSGLSYQRLSEVVEQWPIIGRGDLYYGGATYENRHGLGVQLPLLGTAVLSWPTLPEVNYPKLGLLAVPITRLYDQGATLKPTELLKQRIPTAFVVMNPDDADRMRIPEGAFVRISPEGGSPAVALVKLDPGVPERVLLAPRSFYLAIEEPTPVELLLAERVIL